AVKLIQSAQPITLNLRQFFSNPPNAAALPMTAGDPFVLDANGDIKGVESYFKTLFSGIAEF
ncbi:MAG TPA: hypothetical protein DF383_00490, partial [Deltaproteobacteria bacterium]|nr:hypothetical protein [Deltaproteobacteria bacterium]